MTEVGRSTQGRPLYLVHARHHDDAPFRILFYAQQHGDEVAGMLGMLELIGDLRKNPSLLPENVDLWLIPQVNPDGALAETRRNGAGADLNRDHSTLLQPEVLALYRVVQRLEPHLAVDCHEYARDNEAFVKKGWLRWSTITMDGMNNPLFPASLTKEALAQVDRAAPVMEAAGITYRRYMVGGAPPDDEIRPSAPDLDDGRNGIGAYGTLSFIIESGRLSNSQRDLDVRVQAYRRLLTHLITDLEAHRRIQPLVEAARREPLPAFLPTNYFWANLGGRVTDYPVVVTATGEKALLDPIRAGSGTGMR